MHPLPRMIVVAKKAAGTSGPLDLSVILSYVQAIAAIVIVAAGIYCIAMAFRGRLKKSLEGAGCVIVGIGVMGLSVLPPGGGSTWLSGWLS